MDDFRERVAAIDWERYGVAFGPRFVPGTGVGAALSELVGEDRQRAVHAARKLWDLLCHQHSWLSAAALPALPFLMEVLARSDSGLAVEILDVLHGLAMVTRPEYGDQGPVVTELRRELQARADEIHRWTSDPDPQARDLAEMVVEALGE